jgi:8-oxo-dGTP pyrophosphatase MutT (NUDIX family)
MTSEPTKERPIIALSSRIAYENPWLKIREDTTLRHGGVRGIYGVVETNDSVITAAVNADNELYIVYGYSYPTDTWSWQIPGGGGDGELPEVAAERELVEETGITAKQFKLLGNLIVTCGLLKERMAVVVATDITLGDRPPGTDDADSVREGKFVSFDEAARMVVAGEICDSQTISSLYLIEKWLAGRGVSS